MSEKNLTAEDMAAIWDEVKANQKRLDECSGPHDFSVDADPTRVAFKQWRCSKCKGIVDVHAKHWYEKGLAHGREHA